MSTDPADLRTELDQALADLEHLRQLVAERKVSAAAPHVAKYLINGPPPQTEGIRRKDQWMTTP